MADLLRRSAAGIVALALCLAGAALLARAPSWLTGWQERVFDRVILAAPAPVPPVPVRVIDMDPESVAQCAARSVPAQVGDALKPPIAGDEACVCFNLILHHLVARDEAGTRKLQLGALTAWKDRSIPLFVNEYIYESFVDRARLASALVV